MVNITLLPLYPREITLVSIEVEAGWVPDPV
jgi:hypothetical protein